VIGLITLLIHSLVFLCLRPSLTGSGGGGRVVFSRCPSVHQCVRELLPKKFQEDISETNGENFTKRLANEVKIS